MKALRFLSQFTLICNLCFLLSCYLAWREKHKAASGTSGVVQQLPFLKDTIIVLGFSAIVICFIMNLAYLFLFIAGKKSILPRTLVAINFFFLLLEIVYTFFT